MTNRTARIGNIVLGIWLFLSAFLWPHTASQYNNAWVVGVIAVVIAAVAMGMQQARYLNTALSVWLLLSVWILPRISAATAWNSILVAVAMFILSLVGAERGPGARRMTQRPV